MNNLVVLSNNIDVSDSGPLDNINALLRFLKITKEALDSSKSAVDAFGVPPDNLSKILSNFSPFKHEKYNLGHRIGAVNVTAAWLKGYEIISRFNLINSNMHDVRHFDNAALPGGFILATHHYTKTLYPSKEYTWRASSYIGPNDHLPDEYELYKNYPECWTMHDGNDGDVTDIKNIDDIIATSCTVNLFTSDLGFDSSGDYTNQEKLHMKANVGQILLCINLLETGGNCIIKHYTIHQLFTLSYVLVFAQLFDECYMYKPLSSKRTNSEVYLVGKGFHADRAAQLDKALRRCIESGHFVPIASPRAVEQFGALVAPGIRALAERQIQALTCQNNALRNLKGKYHDVAFCARHIRKISPYRADVDEYYKLCLFEQIDPSIGLKAKNVYFGAKFKN